MTTIDLRKGEIGQLSVEVLIKYIENQTYYKKIVKIKLKTNFILRESIRNIKWSVYNLISVNYFN